MTQIFLKDGIEGLLSLDKGSASLVLSDLPSGETQAEFDRRPDLRHLWHGVWHALEPAGIAVFMASSLGFASDLMRSTPFYRYDMIWKKTILTGFLNAKGRPLRGHEFVLVFWREEGFYEAQMTQGHAPISSNTNTRRARDPMRVLGENYGKLNRATPSRVGATDRYPSSVLSFGSVPTNNKDRTHPQQKPSELLRHLIRTHAAPDSLVVDPFAGSGSTICAAIAEGRRAIGFDTSQRFAPKDFSTQQAKDVSP